MVLSLEIEADVSDHEDRRVQEMRLNAAVLAEQVKIEELVKTLEKL